jgi:hypothetical protein
MSFEHPFYITHHYEEEEQMPAVDLDFVDKVIAEYNIELLTKFQTRKEVRKYFYDKIDPLNYKQIYEIMKDIDRKQNGGELTLNFPKKINNIVNELYESQVI